MIEKLKIIENNKEKVLKRKDSDILYIKSTHVDKPKRLYEIWNNKYFIIPKHDEQWWIDEKILKNKEIIHKIIKYTQLNTNKIVKVYNITEEYIVTEYLIDYFPQLIKSANNFYDNAEGMLNYYYDYFGDFQNTHNHYISIVNEFKKFNEETGCYFSDVCANNIMLLYDMHSLSDYKIIDIGCLRIGKFEIDFPFTQLIHGDGANDIGFIDVKKLEQLWRKTGKLMTTCVSTHNNLDYLKLAIKSVRKNSYFIHAPIIIHADNCVDGTNEWLKENKEKYNLEVYYDKLDPSGIGPGMDFVASKVKSEFINFIHSDFYVGKNWDIELLKTFYKYPFDPIMLFSYRLQPDIFNEKLGTKRPGTIVVDKDVFGEYHNNFDEKYFLNWAEEFSNQNKDFEVRKGEGVSGLIRKKDWDFIGGNDSLFAPASFDDADLFIRMQFENYKFVITANSIIYHFGARASHFPSDDFSSSSERQIKSEQANVKKWISKWGKMPSLDENEFWSISGLEERYEYLKKTNQLKSFKYK